MATAPKLALRDSLHPLPLAIPAWPPFPFHFERRKSRGNEPIVPWEIFKRGPRDYGRGESSQQNEMTLV